jgi:hypothetical protein
VGSLAVLDPVDLTDRVAEATQLLLDRSEPVVRAWLRNVSEMAPNRDEGEHPPEPFTGRRRLSAAPVATRRRRRDLGPCTGRGPAATVRRWRARGSQESFSGRAGPPSFVDDDGGRQRHTGGTR